MNFNKTAKLHNEARGDEAAEQMDFFIDDLSNEKRNRKHFTIADVVSFRVLESFYLLSIVLKLTKLEHTPNYIASM